MASAEDGGQSYWGYLINHQEKKAQPLLQELLEGLARVISRLEPGPDNILTPDQLATFYKSLGGTDFLFRELGSSGLSLMYRTLGCFHSLEPTTNAFDAPATPCLKIPGFVRWQTVQLLLHPDEHAAFIQKAVEIYDVRKPDGTKFPKSIPRESFPVKPDDAMAQWHSTIVERLGEAPNRLKNSPYASPFEPSDRESYFPPGSPHHRRGSRPPRTESPDPRQRVSSSSSRRRSSVPSIPSPADLPDGLDTKFQWASDHAFSAPNTAVPQSPRHRTSASTHTQRPTSQAYHRHSNSYSAAHPVGANSASSKTFNLNFENFHVPFISSPFSSKKPRDKVPGKSARPRKPPSRSRADRLGATSTGSDASSEESLPRHSRYEDHHNHHRRSLWLLPENYNRSQRRHSHDSGSLGTPTYPAVSPQKSPQTAHRYSASQNYMPSPNPSPGLFRENLFSSSAASSAPGSPIVDPSNPKLRVIDPAGKLGRADTRGRSYQSQTQRNYVDKRICRTAEPPVSIDAALAGIECRNGLMRAGQSNGQRERERSPCAEIGQTATSQHDQWLLRAWQAHA